MHSCSSNLCTIDEEFFFLRLFCGELLTNAGSWIGAGEQQILIFKMKTRHLKHLAGGILLRSSHCISSWGLATFVVWCVTLHACACGGLISDK